MERARHAARQAVTWFVNREIKKYLLRTRTFHRACLLSDILMPELFVFANDNEHKM